MSTGLASSLIVSGRSIFALVIREMTATSSRSAPGYLWAVLEPVAGILLLTFVFSLVFRAPPLGTSFTLFYATGLLPVMLYMDVTQKIAQSIRFSKPLLLYPRLTFVDAIMARFLLNFLTQVVVFWIVVAGLHGFLEGGLILDVANILIAFAMAAVLALGVGVMNCFLITRFQSWERIWSVLNRPLFIISCIFYTFESLPGAYREILWYNPLVHVVGKTRQGFYPTYGADYVSYAYTFGVGLILLVAGLLLLRRFHRDLIFK